MGLLVLDQSSQVVMGNINIMFCLIHVNLLLVNTSDMYYWEEPTARPKNVGKTNG